MSAAVVGSGVRRLGWPASGVRYTGRLVLALLHTLRGLIAFAFISLGVLLTKWGVAGAVIRPLIFVQLHRSGLQLLRMVSFLAFALGLLVIGQTVALMTRVGANAWLGTVMVSVVVRELGPMLGALLVLSRTGMANVIELATARALGEVEALEVLGIDPIHYLVVPRIIGMSLGVLSLSVYFTLIALSSGFLWAFIQDVPLAPMDYVRQLSQSLYALDFFLLGVKTAAFGVLIAVITCYHGLARPLGLEEVPRAATQATVQSVVACVLLDALLIVLYISTS